MTADGVTLEGRGGGVSAGTRLAATDTGGAAGPSPLTQDSSFRAAALRAETAMAQARVPARLRGYVRDYFVAIRTLDQP